jgi:hypothetical protein
VEKYVETLKPNTQTLYKSVVYNTMYTEFPDAPVVNIPVSAWVRFFDKQEEERQKGQGATSPAQVSNELVYQPTADPIM